MKKLPRKNSTKRPGGVKYADLKPGDVIRLGENRRIVMLKLARSEAFPQLSPAWRILDLGSGVVLRDVRMLFGETHPDDIHRDEMMQEDIPKLLFAINDYCDEFLKEREQKERAERERNRILNGGRYQLGSSLALLLDDLKREEAEWLRADTEKKQRLAEAERRVDELIAKGKKAKKK